MGLTALLPARRHEAQTINDEIESILSEDQNATNASIGLPGGRGGGGRAGGASASTGGGGPAGSTTPAPPASHGAPAASSSTRGSGGNANENPFAQEANQTRLRDLLKRLNGDSESSSGR